jgi:predicted  nucleic acid-binding Zn-ribbon protein
MRKDFFHNLVLSSFHPEKILPQFSLLSSYTCGKANMAPGKPPTSSSVGKSNANSLSSPVSLLWAHQLRREHSALLGRVEGLARAISNISSAQLNKIAAQVAKAERKSSNVESEQAKLKKELDRACERERRIEEGLTRLSDRLEVSAESIPALHENVRTIKDRVEKDLINRLAFVEHKLQKDAEERERQVRELKAEVRDIQSRSTDIVKEGVIGVRDSMEEVGEQMNQIGSATPLVNLSMMCEY